MSQTKLPATWIQQDANNQLITSTERNSIAAAQSTTIASFENSLGVYIPVIKSAGLSGSTGLTNHANGGVVAAVAGTAGSGSIYLPKGIDVTKPWRCAVLIEINDNQPITELHFCDAGKNFFTGFRFTNIASTGINGGVGGGTTFNSYAGDTNGIPAGTKFWLGMASDGLTITSFLMPDNAPAGMSTSGPVYQSAWNNSIYAVSSSISLTNSGSSCFGYNSPQNRLCRLAIATKSTQNRIIGIYWSQTLNGPKDGQLKPPFVLLNTILQDSSAWLICPGTQGYQPTDLVMLPHPNGNTGYYGVNNLGNSAEILKLYTAGFLLFGITGAQNINDYAGATGSNWGAQAGLKYRKAHLEWIRANIPLTKNLFLIGQSMGCMNSLQFALEHPGTVKAIIGISGVCDLNDSYVNRGFQTIISNAYGTWYACLQAATGIQPDQVVSISGTYTAGATSLTVSALTAAIPAGTTLTLQSGTGPVTVVTAAAAAKNATTVSIQALSADITGTGVKYNMSYYFQQISWGFGAPDEVYYKAPYTWVNIYAAATAYVVNNVLCVPATLTSSTLNHVDPNLNAYVYKYIPVKIYQGDADTLIPPIQTSNFKTNVEAAGGSVQVDTTAGVGHLDISLYKGDDMVSFLKSIL